MESRIGGRMGSNSRRARGGGFRCCLVMLLPASTAAPAIAADPEPLAPPPPSVSGAQTMPPQSAEADADPYARCMRLARQDPRNALRLAQSWSKRGGAHPADHCAAVAQIGLGKYKEGATR